jgi:RNA polymerase primary sigma factor
MWGDLGRDPSGEELARETGIKAKSIRLFQESSKTPVSLDTPIGERQNRAIADLVADENASVPDEAVSLAEMLGHLGGMLDVLDARERKIIRDRFGLGERRVKTLSEIAAGLGVTPERVRQLQQAALDKMRWVLAHQDDPSMPAGASQAA